MLCARIQQAWKAIFNIYGARKLWRELRRQQVAVARCTVQRLMKTLGIQGVIRGKGVKTTVGDQAQPCSQDLVNRQFKASRPNALWVSDFPYVSTWQSFA